jgi:hypothetical protein
MRKAAKLLLGVVTFIPLLAVLSAWALTLSGVRPSSFAPRFDDGAFAYLLGLAPVTVLPAGLAIFYVIDVFRNDRVIEEKKALWGVVILLGNIFAMPVYWYLYVRPERREPSPA